jgi:hypothetical protein
VPCCSRTYALQCHTLPLELRFRIVTTPQRKWCRASAAWCNELSGRDGPRTDVICLSMGNAAYLCIPLHEVCRLMWRNWVFYAYGVYCSHYTLLWQNILETLMYLPQPISLLSKKVKVTRVSCRQSSHVVAYQIDYITERSWRRPGRSHLFQLHPQSPSWSVHGFRPRALPYHLGCTKYCHNYEQLFTGWMAGSTGASELQGGRHSGGLS